MCTDPTTIGSVVEADMNTLFFDVKLGPYANPTSSMYYTVFHEGMSWCYVGQRSVAPALLRKIFEIDSETPLQRNKIFGIDRENPGFRRKRPPIQNPGDAPVVRLYMYILSTECTGSKHQWFTSTQIFTLNIPKWIFSFITRYFLTKMFQLIPSVVLYASYMYMYRSFNNYWQSTLVARVHVYISNPVFDIWRQETQANARWRLMCGCWRRELEARLCCQ
jgi:hypothetical protein